MSPGQNTTENYDHNRWIDSIFQELKTMRSFMSEAVETAVILCKMGFSRIFNEATGFARRLTTLDFIFAGLSVLTMAGACLVLLSGTSLLGYQAFLWLKDGVWTEFPIIVVFNFFFENSWLHAWLNDPEAWHGLQTLIGWLLENVPLSLALIVPGVAGMLIIAGVTVTVLIVRFYQFRKLE